MGSSDGYDQTDDNQLKIELNAVLTSKIFVLEVVNEVRKELLKRTKKLILEIEDKSKDD
jgi:flagellar biosynthesis regulator FlaF